MVSSLDPAHPGENVIDDDHGTYWLSTGLYPQEILLWLAAPTKVASVRVASTRVRRVRFEACPEEDPVTFGKLAEGEFEDIQGSGLQVRELHCSSQDGPTKFVRLLILSGWADFCSIHQIQVEGTAVDAPRPLQRRRSSSTAASSSPTRMSSRMSTVRIPARSSTGNVNSLEVVIPESKTLDRDGHEPDAPRKPDGVSAWKESRSSF